MVARRPRVVFGTAAALLAAATLLLPVVGGITAALMALAAWAHFARHLTWTGDARS
ncbi:hypothetical protein [Streptomyces rectiverticillatus]|uniref:hypothetical protein n=1 Tax=Streptomyces rectiverticillatus TaxID=173860 RepID=UPI003CCD47EB